MASVDLSEQEWGQVMSLLANKCLWSEANPLLMKIGEQLREHAMRQQQSRQPSTPPVSPFNPGNGQEARHE